MPKIDIDAAPKRFGTAYPAPHDAPCDERARIQLGDAAGLDQFGVNLLTLKPGVWSAQRHWHIGEDEFLVMLAGEAVLVDDDGEHVLGAGDCAAFPKNDGNGHHLQNRSHCDCVFVVIGGGTNVGGDYPDIDMRWTDDDRYVHKDGTPY